MADSSHGPNKLLYAAGGWFLGGLAGLIASPVVTFVVGSILPIAAIVGPFVPIICSIIGARMGWKKAAREQGTHVAQTVTRTTVSQSLADESAPTLSKAQALEQVEQQHAQFAAKNEAAPQSDQAPLQTHPDESRQADAYTKNFRPTVSKAEAVQAERTDASQMWR